MIKTMRILSVVLVIIFAAYSFSHAKSDEVWYKIKIQDKHIGFAHAYLETVDSEQGKLKLSKMITKMEFGRAAAQVSLNQSMEYRETLDGKPVSFNSRMSMSQVEQVTEGTFKDGLVTATQTIGGVTKTVNIEVPPNTIFPAVGTTLVEPEDMAVGQKYRFKLFVPDFLSVTDINMTIVEKTKIDIEGKQVDVYAIESVMTIMPNLKMVEYVDNRGEVLRMAQPMMGLDIVLEKTSKENATKEFESVDFLNATTIIPDKLLPKPEKLRQLELKIIPRSKDFKMPEIMTDRQKVKANKDGSYTVTIQTQNLPEKFALSEIKAEDPVVKEYLAATSYIQSDDEDVKNTASRITGETKDAVEITSKIVTWVHENIKKKNFNVGFASASEVIKNMEGDCTEHGVLLAALLKASGIPARVCVGLVYGDSYSSFLYHMWNEVYLNKWIMVDSALNQTAVDATHIKLSDSNLSSDALMQMGVDVIDFIANIDIAIISYNSDNQ